MLVRSRPSEYELVRHRPSPVLNAALECSEQTGIELIGVLACSLSNRAFAVASGSSAGQPRTSSHTLANGSARVRHVRGDRADLGRVLLVYC